MNVKPLTEKVLFIPFPFKLSVVLGALLSGIIAVALTGCGGSSSSGWGVEDILGFEDNFERNLKNLPGNWKGTASSFSHLGRPSEEVTASFRWTENALVGEISFDPCIPPVSLSVTFKDYVILMEGKDSGRSVNIGIDPFIDYVTETTLSTGYVYSSNIEGCPKQSNIGSLHLARQ